MPLIALIVGVVIGAGGVMFGLPGHTAKSQSNSAADLQAYNPKQAVTLQFNTINSNLADSGHYINFSVSFSVMPAVLQAQGGVVASGAGSGGTGSPVLDAKIRNALLDLSRSTTYGQLTSSGGVSTFKREVSVVLQSIFGAGTVHDVYFSQFLIQ